MEFSTEQIDGVAAGISRSAILLDWGCDTL